MSVWPPTRTARASRYLRIARLAGLPRTHRGHILSLVLLTPYLNWKSCLCFTAISGVKSGIAVPLWKPLPWFRSHPPNSGLSVFPRQTGQPAFEVMRSSYYEGTGYEVTGTSNQIDTIKNLGPQVWVIFWYWLSVLLIRKGRDNARCKRSRSYRSNNSGGSTEHCFQNESSERLPDCHCFKFSRVAAICPPSAESKTITTPATAGSCEEICW